MRYQLLNMVQRNLKRLRDLLVNCELKHGKVFVGIKGFIALDLLSRHGSHFLKLSKFFTTHRFAEFFESCRK
jgi:hypothetical protein